MQDNWQEFDLMFKSQLEDAEVKAPRRSWRVLRSRLDEVSALAMLDARSGGTSRRLRYAVAALAFAACLGAGIFFVGTSDSRLEKNAQPAIVADNINPAPSAGDVQDTDIPSVSSLAETARGQQRHGLMQKIEHVYAPSTAQEPSSDMQAAPTEGSAPALADDDRGMQDDNSGVAVSVKGSEDNSAIWAEIAAEDGKRSARRPALYAQGAISGNDSEINIGASGRMAPSLSGQKDIGITESSASVYGVPFSIGIGARFYLTDRFSLGAGLDYSILTRTFSGTYSPDGIASYKGDISGRMRYLGIPVNAFYDVFSAGKSVESSVKFYVYGGGAAEYCISNTYTILEAPGKTVVKDPVKGLQWSVGGGIGVEFRLAEHLGIYFDPGFRYYFNNGQPKSVRTDKPLMVNFEAGLRFKL